MTWYTLTDAGNAELFRDAVRGHVIFDHDRGVWLVWDGRRWAVDSKGEVTSLMVGAIRERHALIVNTENYKDRDKSLVWYRRSENTPPVRAALEQARGLMAVVGSELDTDPIAFNTLSGTVRLDTGWLGPHDPAERITRLAPVEYDQFDTSPTDGTWMRVLHDSTGGDEEMMQFIQVAAGYALTGSTAEEKLIMVTGPGASGKSTLIDAMAAAMGEYATTADFDTFCESMNRGGSGASEDIARLRGARLVTASETSRGRRLAEGKLKNITGGDTVVARHLYRSSFEFKPSFKLWLVANDKPDCREDDSGLWRRIIHIPFDNAVPPEKRDPGVKAYLTDPARGARHVFRWMVEGAKIYLSEGLNVPQCVTASTEAYRREVDPLREFIDEHCRFGPGLWTASARLYHAYKQFALDNGLKPMSMKAVAPKLKDRGCENETRRLDGSQIRGWVGIGLGCDTSYTCDTSSQNFTHAHA